MKAHPTKKALSFSVKRFDDRLEEKPKSLLLDMRTQALLEYYRLQYAELLYRLQLPQQRTQVLNLTRASQESTNVDLMQCLSGMENRPKSASWMGLSLELACPDCGGQLSGRSPPYCSTCKRKKNKAVCSLCHLPLSGELSLNSLIFC